VLPTTSKPWANQASSYNSVYRLPDGRYLVFVRGTCGDGSPPSLGFAVSGDGRVWRYLEENPVIHQGGEGRKGVYRPGFVGYLGKDATGADQYLVAWSESLYFDRDPRLIYGYTSDFKTVRRDRRGYVHWPGADGPVCVRRQGDRLYLLMGKLLHEMKLPVAKSTAATPSTKSAHSR